MKKSIISVAILAVLTSMAVSCQKENFTENQTPTADQTIVRTIAYTVDGAAFQITLHNDAEWDAFVENMLTLSEQGHQVQILSDGTASHNPGAKETHSMTTRDKAEAKLWAITMAHQGYTVMIHYEAGEYTCVAY